MMMAYTLDARDDLGMEICEFSCRITSSLTFFLVVKFLLLRWHCEGNLKDEEQLTFVIAGRGAWDTVGAESLNHFRKNRRFFHETYLRVQ
jgi:hypothetical protein